MRKKIIKISFLFFVSFVSFIYSIKWLDSININLDSDTLDLLISNSNNLSRENLIINFIVRSITDEKYNPVSVVLNKYSVDKESVSVNSDVSLKEPSVPVSKPDDSPVVYIYNTHQTEKYLNDSFINYSIYDASFLLQEELKKLGIYSIVEEGSIKDILDINNWNYASSYKVSRMYLESAKKNNPSLEYFIDLHRDSVSKEISTAVIDGKSYARTMFLLGLENTNYSSNQVILNDLENWLDTNYPGISRGIYEKGGAGVNGVYNQDFSSNCFLIEVGGHYNTLEEVNNTIEVIAKMFKWYLGK